MAEVVLVLTPWTRDHATREGETATGVAATKVYVDGVQVPPARVKVTVDYFAEVEITDPGKLGLPDYPISEIVSSVYDPVERRTVLTLPVTELVIRPPGE